MSNNALKILLLLLLVFGTGPVALLVFPESGFALFLKKLFPIEASVQDEDPRQADAKRRGMRLLYQFIDERDNVQIVENLADVPPEKRAGVGFFEVPRSDPAKTSRSASKQAPQIVMYTTSWCGYCERLRNDLNRAQIPFEERDVERNDAFEEEYRKLGVRGVPTTVVGDEVVPGYQPQRIKELYKP